MDRTKKSDVRIFGFENLFPNSANLFKSIDCLYGSYIDNNKKSSVLMANKVNFVIDNLGSGGGWHRDSLNRRQLKFMIYLNRVNEENGPFEYLMGSHRLNSKLKTNHFLFKKTRYTSEDVKNTLGPGSQKNFRHKWNVCLLTHQDSRGNPISTGVRYAITKYMFDGMIPTHIQKIVLNQNNAHAKK